MFTEWKTTTKTRFMWDLNSCSVVLFFCVLCSGGKWKLCRSFGGIVVSLVRVGLFFPFFLPSQDALERVTLHMNYMGENGECIRVVALLENI